MKLLTEWKVFLNITVLFAENNANIQIIFALHFKMMLCQGIVNIDYILLRNMDSI